MSHMNIIWVTTCCILLHSHGTWPKCVSMQRSGQQSITPTLSGHRCYPGAGIAARRPWDTLGTWSDLVASVGPNFGTSHLHTFSIISIHFPGQLSGITSKKWFVICGLNLWLGLPCKNSVRSCAWLLYFTKVQYTGPSSSTGNVKERTLQSCAWESTMP